MADNALPDNYHLKMPAPSEGTHTHTLFSIIISFLVSLIGIGSLIPSDKAITVPTKPEGPNTGEPPLVDPVNRKPHWHVWTEGNESSGGASDPQRLYQQILESDPTLHELVNEIIKELPNIHITDITWDSFLKTVKLVFETSTAAVFFFEKLMSAIHRHKKTQSNSTIVTIEGNMITIKDPEGITAYIIWITLKDHTTT